ncbi:MAG: helix-turn-helix domain-containing protein, partial [Pseudomonadota bacterium]
IRVFVAVAEHGSLSAARRRLHMPLTTVSRQLAALEGQLGLRLHAHNAAFDAHRGWPSLS